MSAGDVLDLKSDHYDQASKPPSICGMIYAGERHVISGPPESLKSLVTLAIALEHMRAGGKVAFYDFENGPYRVKRMLFDLGATLDNLDNFNYIEVGGVLDDSDIEWMQRKQISLAVIDAVAGAFAITGLDDNSRMDVERFASAWVNPLWKLGITTIVIDHVSKAGIVSGSKFTIGSERKIGMTDVHLGIEVVSQLSRGTQGRVRVRTHKDRPGHLLRPVACELELNSDQFTHLVTYSFKAPSYGGDSWKPTVVMERVLAHFKQFPDPQSDMDLVNAVWGNPEYIVLAIATLITEGELVRDENGQVSMKPVSVTFEQDELWEEEL